MRPVLLNDYPMDCVPENCGEKHHSFEAAKFILKTRDGKKLPQTVVNGIIADTQAFQSDEQVRRGGSPL